MQDNDEVNMSIKKQVEIDVLGMTCPTCAVNVETALRTIDGIEEVHVPNWNSNKALVSLDADVQEQELIEAMQHFLAHLV